MCLVQTYSDIIKKYQTQILDRGQRMKDKLIQFFLLGCGNLEEAERELNRSIREVQKKTGFNEKLSLQKLAEELGL